MPVALLHLSVLMTKIISLLFGGVIRVRMFRWLVYHPQEVELHRIL